MYNQPYFIPGNFSSFGPNMIRGTMNGAIGNTIRGGINGARLAGGVSGRGLGLLGKLGSSVKAMKGVNWGSLITNTSKTLNVVNQAIPLVKQVGPMVNNMKSIVKIASIFKDETDIKSIPNTKINNSSNNYSTPQNKEIQPKEEKKESNHNYYDSSPTFFINS